MSILFVIENANLRGGTEIQSFNQLHALCAIGEDVWILSLVPYEGADEHVLSLSDEEYAQWMNIASKIWIKFTFSIFSDRILRKILKDNDLELKCVSSSGYYPAFDLIPEHENLLLTIPEWLNAGKLSILTSCA